MNKANDGDNQNATAFERGDVNPYLGKEVPMGGVQSDVGSGLIDENLRKFMLMVYNYMFMGLLVTAVTAFLTYSLSVTGNPELAAVSAEGHTYQISETQYLTKLGAIMWQTPLSYLICFGPLLVLIFCSSVFRGINPRAAFAVFMLVSVLIGISFSGFALTYTSSSIVQVFFVTAAAFGALSLFGYTTKKDLSGWGTFLWMGFFGLLIAVVVNLFMGSDAIQFAICSIGVIVFAGFTAYDTQMIKEAYSHRLTDGEVKSIAISGALDIYLDFINLFQFLLYFLGDDD